MPRISVTNDAGYVNVVDAVELGVDSHGYQRFAYKSKLGRGWGTAYKQDEHFFVGPKFKSLKAAKERFGGGEVQVRSHVRRRPS